MGYPTPIEWTDATWNPIGGCSIASPGCSPCYAQQLAGTRLKNHPLYAGITDLVKGRPIFNGTMTAAPADHDVWTWPIRWRGVPSDQRPVLGWQKPSMIFVGDMSDVFHENRPIEQIDRVFATISLSRHVFQVLTKRADRMADWSQRRGIDEMLGAVEHRAKQLLARLHKPIPIGKTLAGTWPWPHIWFGASAERQKEFDERWPHLRRLTNLGFIVFISYEPALGPLTLPPDFLALGDRAQLIAGGCSGDRAWPAHPDWFRSVRDQCGAAGVPFFFKQWGEYAPCRAPVLEWSEPGGLKHVEMVMLPNPGTPPVGAQTDKQMRRAVLGHDSQPMARVGKKAAGHLLDGVEHRAFPRITTPAIGAAA